MNDPVAAEGPFSADRVPTLTEVVELGLRPLAAARAPAFQPAAPEALVPQPDPAAGASAIDAQALVALVLQELAPRIDGVFEARLREALAPALAQAADGLIRDSRQELLTSLRELVEEAVARSLQRQGRA